MAKGAPVKQKDIESIPRLGHIYWHWISGIRLTLNEVKNGLKKTGYTEDQFLFASPKKAYHAALRDIRSMKFDKTRILVRRLPVASVNLIRHQITFEALTKKEDALWYRKEMFTQFDRRNGTVTVEVVGSADENDKLETIVNDAFDERMKIVTEQEVRDFIQRQGRMMNHVICKPRGGIWFVPEEKTDELTKLEAFVSEMGGTLYMQPVFDTSQWRSDVGQFVDHDFDVEVEALNRKLEAQLATGTPKKKALETLAKNYHALHTKARAYTRLMNYRSTHIDTTCKEQTDLMEKVIRGEVDSVTVQLSYKETKKIEREEEKAAKSKEVVESAVVAEENEAPF